jgi:hypothetical protein
LGTVEQNRGEQQVTTSAQTFELLAQHIGDSNTNWSLGAFGAIAEFTRDPDEPTALSRTLESLSATTGRGGIRLTPTANMQPCASESAVGQTWNHRVALCLPREQSAMSRRSAVTELGPDVEALREQDRHGVLFDIGLDCLQVDCCIRLSDAAVIDQLRAHVGRTLFEVGNPAMGIIFAANPHRVFISRLGRIEVFQPIPPADGKSPQGPHTHVLPKLLAHKRTHAATEPIPEDLVPCVHFYPPHPAKDAMGRPRAFDIGRHETFQQLFETYGNPELVTLKRRITTAIVAGEEPAPTTIADGRFARASIRVALRQLHAADPSRPKLAAWMAAHENAAHAGIEEEDPLERGH